MPNFNRLKTLALAILLAVPAFAQGVPKPINPGSAITPPSDAVVLFDGLDLGSWTSIGGGEAKWKVENDVIVVNSTGNIRTKEEFGSIQLHIEWATPAEVKGEGQDRGNSGVYLQGRYEIQVLDSYNNKTTPNGHAGAFYGVSAPLVYASRKPGEWQTFDIVFHPPKLAADKTTVQPGSITVFHNGILVQDHVPVKGDVTTSADFKGIVEKGPLVLQDHGSPVRYRNIWVRKLNSPPDRK